ncbi:MAG: exosortase/archaeosortase family protein, partial [Alkalinema sp. RL_2_19]|nr:exosortase/archaeosortase family protein [Alkalinema sp. RL_2_19]
MQLKSQLKSSSNLIARLWQRGMRDVHSRIVTVAILFVACYLPTWISSLVAAVVGGTSDSILNLGFIALGIQIVYQHRPTLQAQAVEADDRFLGYAVIGIGLTTFVIFHSLTWSPSFQALAVMLMLIGIAWSSWGLGFFRQFPLASSLILVAVYPSLSYIVIRVCRFFTASEDMLEQVMAVAGAAGLNLIGLKATAQAALVSLPEGSVLVAPGCSGFDMAFTLLGTGFLMGKFMQLSWRKTAMIMAIGWSLSMLL